MWDCEQSLNLNIIWNKTDKQLSVQAVVVKRVPKTSERKAWVNTDEDWRYKLCVQWRKSSHSPADSAGCLVELKMCDF